MSVLKIFLLTLLIVLPSGGLFAQVEESSRNGADVIDSTSERQIPFKRGQPDQDISLTRVIITFLFVALIFCAFIYLAKKMGANRLLTGSGSNSRLKIVESKRLSPKSSVTLIEIDERDYIVAQSGDAISVVLHGNKVKDDI